MAPLVLLSLLTSAASLPHVDVPFERYQLARNGLTVILSEDHSLPIVAVNIWYNAGPINETAGRTGFAHLFEHLMFQGSAHVGDDEHFKRLSSAGASMVNGTTDFDRTNYFETVPTNQLALALWLESDRMGFLKETITQEKLDSQRAVVMNERRQSVDNVPYGPSTEALVQLVFADAHPYHGYVIGSMADLEAATLDDVHAFYDRYYSPANATLVIAGDFDARAARALVDIYFGTLARRPAPESAAVVTAPITHERRQIVREPVQLGRLSMAWIAPAAYAPGDADCDFLAFILGRGRTSRLYQRLVYDLELAQEVSATQESLALGSLFTVAASARPGVDLAVLERETEKILSELQETPPTEHEIERARNQLTTAMVSPLQQLGGFGGRADMLNRYQHYLRDPGYFTRDLARYGQVTPASVQAMARALLRRDARAVVTTEPQP
ncbi:MAG: pitrilysin family protein [Myxococcota bacterium]